MEIKTQTFADIQEVEVTAYDQKVVVHVTPRGGVIVYHNDTAIYDRYPRTVIG